MTLDDTGVDGDSGGDGDTGVGGGRLAWTTVCFYLRGYKIVGSCWLKI